PRTEEAGSCPACLQLDRRKSSFPCSRARWPRPPDWLFQVCASASLLLLYVAFSRSPASGHDEELIPLAERFEPASAWTSSPRTQPRRRGARESSSGSYESRRTCRRGRASISTSRKSVEESSSEVRRAHVDARCIGSQCA